MTENLLDPESIIKLNVKPTKLIPLWEFVLAFIFALAFSLLFFFGKFNSLENDTIDYRFKQRGELPKSRDIVLVQITDNCIQELGTWPWKRETHGKLINKLKDAGAKAVAFDIMFSEESLAGKEDDEKFANAIEEFKNVILPFTVNKETVLNPETFEPEERIVPSRPCETLRNKNPYEGFIDVDHQTLNPDGIIRKLFLQKDAGEFSGFAFGITAASVYLGTTPDTSDKNYMSFGTEKRLPYYVCYEPTAKAMVSSYMLNYAGGSSFEEISYSDVLTGRFPEGFFNGKLVVVGTVANGISEDKKSSPYGVMAGVGVHSNLMYNILSNKILTRNSVLTTILVIFIFAFGSAYALWKSRRFFADIATLSSVILWAMLGIWFFHFGIVTDITPILFMVPIQWAITRLIQQFQTLSIKNYELAKKVRELAIINEITQAVSFMGDLGKTLDAIVSRGVQVLNAQRGSIFMLDDKYEDLVERSIIYGVSGEVELDPELKKQFKSGKGVAGEVFNSGKPRLIQNIRHDKNFTFRENERDNMKSMICVPLMIDDNAIGVMNIVNKRDGRFNVDDLQTALTMANQAAVVIEKARLYNLATIDGLTGLVVRRHFQAKIEEEFRRAKRYDKQLSYLMTDIDHFKKFNDTYGHQTGDMVLREVAAIVRKSVRDTDIAARYGGEEFCVILPETDVEGAMLFAERLRESVQNAVFTGPTGDLKVTISVGVSSIPTNNPDTATEMIKFADDALYVCKENGRNRVEFAKNKPVENQKEENSENNK